MESFGLSCKCRSGLDWSFFMLESFQNGGKKCHGQTLLKDFTESKLEIKAGSFLHCSKGNIERWLGMQDLQVGKGRKARKA